jgi:leader peptidase (prepilin peptidase)/N-methyltransferase
MSFWWFACAWTFVFGACVGSFLNVVIYRLPAGKSLLYPGSRCPKCETPIRATDNLPIFGWLRLAGRCRACQASISPRYPTVELAMAVLFTLLAVLEPLAHGANLPSSLGDALGRWSDELLYVVYAYHVTLVCGLLSAALIEYDGHALPIRLFAPLVLVGVVVPLVWPEVRPVSSHWPADLMPWIRPGETAIQDMVAGVAIAALLAAAALPSTRRGASGRFGGRSILAVFVCIGLFLGWQAACAVAVLSAASQLAVGLVGRIRVRPSRLGWIGCLAPWSFVWIVAWKTIVCCCPYVGQEANGWTLLVAAAATAVLSGVTWTFAGR